MEQTTPRGGETDSPAHDGLIEKLEKIVESMPSSANAHYNLGIALARIGQWDAAI
jgi:hypothetical protein